MSHFPKRSSNKYFAENKQLSKRRVAEQKYSCSDSCQTEEPDPTLLQMLKDIMRTLQMNQKSLSIELNVR